MNSGTQDLPDSVAQHPVQKDLVQFGVFELNMQTGELRKDGVRIRLQGYPMRFPWTAFDRIDLGYQSVSHNATSWELGNAKGICTKPPARMEPY